MGCPLQKKYKIPLSSTTNGTKNSTPTTVYS